MGPITTIKIPLFDLKYDKINEEMYHFVEIHPMHLYCKLEAFLDKHPREEDENNFEVKFGVYTNCTVYVLKKMITGLYSAISEDSVWMLNVYYGDQYLEMKFKKESELRNAESHIMEWLLTVPDGA